MSGIGGRTDWESFLSVPDIHNLAAELELDLSVVETNNELLRSADLEVLLNLTFLKVLYQWLHLLHRLADEQRMRLRISATPCYLSNKNGGRWKN
jgi:hypothetical protein